MRPRQRTVAPPSRSGAIAPRRGPCSALRASAGPQSVCGGNAAPSRRPCQPGPPGPAGPLGPARVGSGLRWAWPGAFRPGRPAPPSGAARRPGLRCPGCAPARPPCAARCGGRRGGPSALRPSALRLGCGLPAVALAGLGLAPHSGAPGRVLAVRFLSGARRRAVPRPPPLRPLRGLASALSGPGAGRGPCGAPSGRAAPGPGVKLPPPAGGGGPPEGGQEKKTVTGGLRPCHRTPAQAGSGMPPHPGRKMRTACPRSGAFALA
jgi:hypothetical protein